MVFEITDLEKEIVYLFSICYEYNVNINELIKIYKVSPAYFWNLLNIIFPALRIGTRKVVLMNDQVDRLIGYIKKGGTVLEYDKKIAQIFPLYVADSFSDGNQCIHYTDITSADTLYNEKGTKKHLKSLTYSDLAGIKYIKRDNSILYRSSRINYILEKYYGDLGNFELCQKTIKQIQEMVFPKKNEEK
jgi:hypothetical protein